MSALLATLCYSALQILSASALTLLAKKVTLQNATGQAEMNAMLQRLKKPSSKPVFRTVINPLIMKTIMVDIINANTRFTYRKGNIMQFFPKRDIQVMLFEHANDFLLHPILQTVYHQ